MLFPHLFRQDIIGPVIINRINFSKIGKKHNLDRPVLFRLDFLKIVICYDNIFALFILEPLHDVVAGQFPFAGRARFFIPDPFMIILCQLIEMDIVILHNSI